MISCPLRIIIVLFSLPGSEIKVKNQGCVSDNTKYLRSELHAVRGHFGSTENRYCRKYAEEGAAGDKTRGDECAAVGAATGQLFILGAASYKIIDKI